MLGVKKIRFSIEAMIKNNVLDAKKLLDYLKQNKPSHFFCVSTDKAANPVNVMGGSKKMMENVIMSYSKDLKLQQLDLRMLLFQMDHYFMGI